MSKLLGLRAYARLRRARGLPGGRLSSVQKAIATGRIAIINGKIDPDVADIQWERNTDPDQQKRASGAVPPPTTRAPATSPSSAIYAPREVHDRLRSRAEEATRADAARADLLEFELAQKRGALVSAEDVRRAAMEKAQQARDALLSIPTRLASIIAAETDQAKVHDLLDVEMRRICAALAAGDETKH